MVRTPPGSGGATTDGLSLYKVLDERIDDIAEIVRIHYNLQELCDPASVTEVLPFLPPIEFPNNHMPGRRSYRWKGRSECGNRGSVWSLKAQRGFDRTRIIPDDGVWRTGPAEVRYAAQDTRE